MASSTSSAGGDLDENERKGFRQCLEKTRWEDAKLFYDGIVEKYGCKGPAVQTLAEIFGEFNLVMDTVKETTKKYFEADPSTILVAKFLNRDRRNKKT